MNIENLKKQTKEFFMGVKKALLLALMAYIVGFGFTFGAATSLKYDRIIGDSFIAIMQVDLEK